MVDFSSAMISDVLTGFNSMTRKRYINDLRDFIVKGKKEA